jgi:hypothetical protein
VGIAASSWLTSNLIGSTGGWRRVRVRKDWTEVFGGVIDRDLQPLARTKEIAIQAMIERVQSGIYCVR